MRFYTIYNNLKDKITPILKESRFFEAGVLTPEEFVQAGDFLVSKCPTWSWSGGVKEKKRNYLPEDKQYLITKNVPCVNRAKDMECAAEDEGERITEDGWIEPYYQMKKQDINQIEEIDSDMKKLSVTETSNEQEIDDIDDIDELEEIMNEDDFDKVDPDELIEDNILKTRTYNICITYDKGYQTPRIWLFGFDENHIPLTHEQIFEDISEDHAKKTVTIETHPHENYSLATVHPCRHANVTKKIVDSMLEAGHEIRPDMALLIFLKFMSSVLPTINYDFTISLEK
ncbi:autophagocytosis associated protein [Neocallimastix lanati (nom. inval.)]|nr:autophagocytosis associated protein [Neocallimastix sp. JGI-2020a]